MIIFKHHGNFSNSEKFLNRARSLRLRHILERYAQKGVAALAAATPVDSGLTSQSWGYEIVTSRAGSYTINWTNSNVNNGVPIAILIQYGHGTGNGGYVEGRDYINPALQPIFDQMASSLWEEVIRL